MVERKAEAMEEMGVVKDNNEPTRACRTQVEGMEENMVVGTAAVGTAAVEVQVAAMEKGTREPTKASRITGVAQEPAALATVSSSWQLSRRVGAQCDLSPIQLGMSMISTLFKNPTLHPELCCRKYDVIQYVLLLRTVLRSSIMDFL